MMKEIGEGDAPRHGPFWPAYRKENEYERAYTRDNSQEIKKLATEKLSREWLFAFAVKLKPRSVHAVGGRPQRCVHSGTHRVLLNFIHYKESWDVAFLEADCRTSLPRKFTFKSEDKIREMFKRASALRQLEDEQAMEHGIATGRGGFWLELNEEQYATLKTKHQ
jgi:hypothetical protein